VTGKFKWQTRAFALIAVASAALYFSASAGITALTIALLGLVGIGMLIATWAQ
jgi:hypothetical protein